MFICILSLGNSSNAQPDSLQSPEFAAMLSQRGLHRPNQIPVDDNMNAGYAPRLSGRIAFYR